MFELTSPAELVQPAAGAADTVTSPNPSSARQ